MVGGSSNLPPGEPPIPLFKKCIGCKRTLEVTSENWFFRSPTAKYSPGKAYGPCRECRARKKTKHPEHPHGLVPVDKVYVLMRELRDRCGSVEEAAAYSGINAETVRQVCNRKRPTTTKQTVRLMVLALYERRKFDRMNGSSERFLHARRMQIRMEERMSELTGY